MTQPCYLGCRGGLQLDGSCELNHFGLSLNDPRAREFLREQMEEFFFGEDAAMPEGWTPEGVPGPPAKGGGAPQRK